MLKIKLSIFQDAIQKNMASLIRSIVFFILFKYSVIYFSEFYRFHIEFLLTKLWLPIKKINILYYSFKGLCYNFVTLINII